MSGTNKSLKNRIDRILTSQAVLRLIFWRRLCMLGRTRCICWLAVLSVSLCLSASAELGVDWTSATLSADWSARGLHSSVVYDGKIWVIGGRSEIDYPFPTGSYECKNDVWYSLDGENWTSATLSAPWPPRWGHSSVVYDGKMWVIGGSDVDNSFFSDIYYNDVWCSSDGENWTSVTLSAPWQPRYGHTSVVYDGKMWVIGGAYFEDFPSGGILYQDVWYTSDGVNWTSATLSAACTATAGVGEAVVHDNKMWVLGGSMMPIGSNEVWSSSDGEHWTSVTLSAEWSVRVGHTSAVYDGKMWVLGGSGYSNSGNDVWYSTDGENWTSATISADWPIRSGHTSVVHDGKMWVIGGEGEGEGWPYSYKNDVWYTWNPPPIVPASAVSDWRLYE